jgi:hypothetical protein
VVKRRHDKERQEDERRDRLHYLLLSPHLRHWPDPRAALEQFRVVHHEVDGDRKHAGSEDAKEQLRPPVAQGPGRQEQSETNQDHQIQDARKGLQPEVSHIASSREDIR